MRVSFAIPTRDQAPFIARCIRPYGNRAGVRHVWRGSLDYFRNRFGEMEHPLA
jgi:hypothetical protein